MALYPRPLGQGVTMNQITNVREIASQLSPQEQKSTARKVWENLQYLNLALTIGGQVVIGGSYLIGQGAWLIANVIAVARDIILKRPAADVVKDVAMTALTAGLIVFYLLGGF